MRPADPTNRRAVFTRRSSGYDGGMQEPKKRRRFWMLVCGVVLTIFAAINVFLDTARKHATIIDQDELPPLFPPGSKDAPVRITDVRVGFPAGADPGGNAKDAGRYFKPGAWAPVMVDLIAGSKGLHQVWMMSGFWPAFAYQLLTATADNDNILSVYPFELPDLGPNEHARVLTYMRPCATRVDLTLSVREAYGYVSGAAKPDLTMFRKPPLIRLRQSPESLAMGDHLFLTAGLVLPCLEQALTRSNERNTANYRVAHIDSAEPLPAEWFGYDAVDLLLVGTSDPSFVDRLAGQPKQSAALASWVRHGGRLLVSTGRKPEVAEQLIERLGLSLPVEIAGRTSVPRLDAVETWLRERQPPPLSDVSRGVAHARFKPGRLAETVIAQKNGQAALPLVLRVPCGLGQVTLIAFDVDQAPFKGWPAEGEFWYKLLNVPQPALGPSAGSAREAAPDEGVTDLASILQNRLEAFADLPDAAKHLKGDEVHINKVDMVDVDFHSKRIIGSTWFCLFSAGSHDFTFCLDLALPVAGFIEHPTPADEALAKDLRVVPGLYIVSRGWVSQTERGDDWMSRISGNARGDGLLSWLARPETGLGGYGRARMQGPVRGHYEYAQNDSKAAGQAAGLERVPTAAGSAKSFSGRWVHSLNPKLPLATTDLHRQGDGSIVGTITNRLPGDLQDAYLIVGGDWTRHAVFPLGTLRRDNPRQVSLKAGAQGKGLTEWLPSIAAPRGRAQETELPLDMLMRRLMFYGEGSRQDHVLDAPLRYLDQSWRVPLKGEAILVGRLAPVQGSVKEVAWGAASPIHLRMFSEATVPDGTMQQDTFVRMFLPLRQDAEPGASSTEKKLGGLRR